MIILSCFNYVALLYSTLANVSMPWSWGCGTMAAVVLQSASMVVVCWVQMYWFLHEEGQSTKIGKFPIFEAGSLGINIWHPWCYTLLPQCISFNSFTLNPLFSLFRCIWFWTLLLWWISFHSFTLQISLFHHSIPVMGCAHTGTEPKCKNASTVMGTLECQFR